MSTKCRVLKSGWCEITQGFGGSNSHRGLDLVNKGYTIGDVVSYDDGKVLLAVTGYGNGKGEGVNWRYGNFVKVLHNDGTVCLYAHLEYTNLKVNQKISKGDLIGRMGNSGNSSGAHLHWEFWSKNNYYSNIDPKPYLSPVELPATVTENTKVNQVKVVCGNNTLRVRTGHSTSSSIIGFATPGFYNIVSTYEDGTYTWYEVEEGKWFASASGCTEYHPIVEETKVEEPVIEEPAVEEPVADNNTTETTETETDDTEITIKNTDKKNPLIEFIKWLLTAIFKK